jgi:lipoic acid synthetase
MKPLWLNKKINLTASSRMRLLLRDSRVETVCEQALCPNIGECSERKEAAFLILGRECTRGCSFCNIEKGTPQAPDFNEPARVADAAARLSLRHVVITSVTRDDLEDGGAGIFADTVVCVRRKLPHATVEVLIPDFRLSAGSLTAIANSRPDIVAHNVETVPSLYPAVRQGADYLRSLNVLREIKQISPRLKTKSGIMLGMGEKREEVYSVMRDLRSAECDFLSIGQYLAPSLRHYPVKEYIAPEQFSDYKTAGEKFGFAHVESGPYVRSSYFAAEYKGVTPNLLER